MLGLLISAAFIIVAAAIFFKVVLLPMFFRTVVSTNEIHVVQTVGSTTAYGAGEQAGNVYYKWPSWVPKIGCSVTVLPVSVFSQSLQDYPGYDKGRVPFLLDVIGFFRVSDPRVAAQRVSDIKQMTAQLDGILKGAIRAILASSEIETILEGRNEFGQKFTEAVDTQLKEWGVSTVKALELMDIRDTANSQVIANIMAVKKSKVEMESRVQVAQNIKQAEIAEIERKRAVALQQQEADQQVGERTAEKNQAIGIAQQKSDQAVQVEMAVTAEKTMAVAQVNKVRQAEIERDAAIVAAAQAKAVMITNSEGDKQRTILTAEAALQQAQLEATGIAAKGSAEGSAQEAVLMAPVNSQIALAREIGANENYQKYLVGLRQIEAGQAIGVEQAKALEKAIIKIIATTGSGPSEGIKSVMDLFTPKGVATATAALDVASEAGSLGKVVTGLKKVVDKIPGTASGHD